MGAITNIGYSLKRDKSFETGKNQFNKGFVSPSGKKWWKETEEALNKRALNYYERAKEIKAEKAEESKSSSKPQKKSKRRAYVSQLQAGGGGSNKRFLKGR